MPPAGQVTGRRCRKPLSLALEGGEVAIEISGKQLKQLPEDS